MYTEENEFNYDDYLDEENNYNKKPFIDFKFILKIFLIVLLIILIIFLVFKIKNRNINNEVAMIDNVSLIRDASHIYFFENNNLPNNISESKTVTVKELIENELVTALKDSNGNVCGYNTSNATITKNKNDYKLIVNLSCITENDEKTFYYDLNGNCLTCNGEAYTETNEEETNETVEEVIIDNSNTEVIDNNNSNQNNENTCGIYSSWTTVYKDDPNLERETRTLIKAYKDEITYGEWIEAGTNKVEGNANLEVKTYEVSEIETTKNCSSETTKKPESKENRIITTRVDTKSSTKKVCSGGKTYTRTLTKWDNSAYSCKSYGIGKVVCTYKTKKTCTNKTITSKVTYYTYCDNITNNVTRTYYQTRTVNHNIVYTDYILESEIPDGYKKVEGSELIQYRYREKCGK